MYNKNKPIKVLFISHSSDIYGGAEKSFLLLLKSIDRKRFDPVVIIPGSGSMEEELDRSGIRTYKIYYRWWFYRRLSITIFLQCIARELLALPKFLSIIKKEKIEIVYTNTIVIFSGAISAFIAGIPHIWHIREIINNKFPLYLFLPNKFVLFLVLKFSNRIIAVSQAVADQFSANNLNKINVVPNAVDFHVFEGNTLTLNIKGINPEDYLIAVIGRLEERKGQDYAIRAVKAASKKIPNIKLLLIGKDYGFRKQLEQLISELNLSDKVVFTGYRDDVPQILQHCKVLLMTSVNEPFARILMEAMAAGVPVIGTNCDGTKEIVQDGITGFLVSLENPSDMAEKIIKLYDNPELAEKFRNNGKKLIRDKYTIDRYVQNIEKIIIELI